MKSQINTPNQNTVFELDEDISSSENSILITSDMMSSLKLVGTPKPPVRKFKKEMDKSDFFTVAKSES